MKKETRRVFFLTLLFLMSALACHADWFKGKLVNAETGEPLIGASIRSEVNPHPGWSIQGNAETDSTGCFIMASGWEGRILFTCSMIGYKNYRKVDYAFGRDVKDTTDLGTIKLQPTVLMLREVEVTAKIPRFTMSGDTIVFNPEAFKLKEGDRLADLIKKLPGVENRDGKLYWNDKPIRLMMNGKNLFGGDQIVDQLPAEVAKKIKLYDRKSELARHTGKDDGAEDNVLDIQVKPGFLDKWYGELEALYQTKKRYMFDLTASKLSDHDPQMLYLQANNINREISRTMRQWMNANIDGDGKSQYGSYNYQHNWLTKGAEDLDNNMVNMSANLGHSDGWMTQRQSTETFFPNEERTMSLSQSYRNNHKLSPQLSANLYMYTDSLNSVKVNASASYEKTRGLNEDEGASYSFEPDQFQYYSLAAAMGAKPGDALFEHLVTRNRNYQTSEGQDRKLSIDYEWTHYLGKKGSFALSGYTKAQGSDNDTHNNRNLEYLREGRSEKQWQRFDYLKHDVESSLSAMFDYWLTDKLYFNMSDGLSYSRSRSRRNVFSDTDESLVSDGKPTTLDAANRMDATVRAWTNKLTLKSTIKPIKNFMIMPKFEWTANREDADYLYGALDTATVRNSHAYTPSLFLKWKMSRVRNMDLSFAYNTTVPELLNTFAFRNTIDPLSISTGNAGLGNTHSHVTTLGYRRMWLRKQIVLGLSASYQKDINPMATLFSYSSRTGVYTSKPMNVKGGDQWKLDVNYDQGLGIDFRLQNKLSLISAQTYGFLTLVDNADPNALPTLNHQKRFAINEDFNFSYEANNLQVTLFDRLNWSRYRYDATSYNSSPLLNNVGLYANIELKPFTIYFQVKDQFRSGYQTSAMNGHRVLADAYVIYTFFKQKCQLMLRADDIFNKDIYYDSNYTAFQRTESSEDYLHHYVTVKFTYRFDAKESKKSKSRGMSININY